MKPLRHPIRAIREPFGTAGLVVACVALVAALGGTAIAAKGALTGKQKKEVEKIAKKFAGKSGAPGATGPAGAPGAAGKEGAAGKNGANGANGESVTGTPIAAGGACGAGVTGVKYTLGANSTNVCNGKDGTTGFTSTLPSGKTETGTWGGAFSEGPVIQPISFPIPLSTAPDPVFVGPSAEEKEDGEDAGCPGLEADGTPTAEKGIVCVYLRENLGDGLTTSALFLDPSAPTQFAEGATPAGTLVSLECTANPCFAIGTWAVTAE